MEAAGDDVDDNEADTQTHTNTLTQRRRTTFAAMQLMQIYWKMLGNIFAFFSAAFSFVPITFFSSSSFCILFVHIWRLLQFIFNFIVCCKQRGSGKAGRETREKRGKEILKHGNNRNVYGRGRVRC